MPDNWLVWTASAIQPVPWNAAALELRHCAVGWIDRLLCVAQYRLLYHALFLGGGPAHGENTTCSDTGCNALNTCIP